MTLILPDMKSQNQASNKRGTDEGKHVLSVVQIKFKVSDSGVLVGLQCCTAFENIRRDDIDGSREHLLERDRKNK